MAHRAVVPAPSVLPVSSLATLVLLAEVTETVRQVMADWAILTAVFGPPTEVLPADAEATEAPESSETRSLGAAGLVYMWNRWQDPATGGFISEDPEQAGDNWYTYGSNNPMSHKDRTGLDDGDGGDAGGNDPGNGGQGFASANGDNPGPTSHSGPPAFVIQGVPYYHSATFNPSINGYYSATPPDDVGPATPAPPPAAPSTPPAAAPTPASPPTPVSHSGPSGNNPNPTGVFGPPPPRYATYGYGATISISVGGGSGEEDNRVEGENGPGSKIDENLYRDPEAWGAPIIRFENDPYPVRPQPQWRTDPKDLEEQIALNLAKRNPDAGKPLPIRLGDPRWPAEKGWQKMQFTFRNLGSPTVVVHYVFNAETSEAEDFKVTTVE